MHNITTILAVGVKSMVFFYTLAEDMHSETLKQALVGSAGCSFTSLNKR